MEPSFYFDSTGVATRQFDCNGCDLRAAVALEGDVGTSPTSNTIGVISYTPSLFYLAATSAAIPAGKEHESSGDGNAFEYEINNGFDLECGALTSPTHYLMGVISYTPGPSFYFVATGILVHEFDCNGFNLGVVLIAITTNRRK